MKASCQTIEEALAGLNEQQRRAATHDNSPLLIVAGAGTGKTTTLAHRVAHMIATGTDPGRILLLTFTRRSAAEMLRRVEGILRQLESSTAHNRSRLTMRRVWGGTFHSIATRLLRQHGRLVGLHPDFTILDRSDSEDLLNVVRSELELAQPGNRFPLKGTCLSIYSRCVNSRQKLDAVLQKFYPWCVEHSEDLKRLFQAYVDRKEAQSSLDYDDLLVFWNSLLAEPAGAEAIGNRFDCVLVDEYQDTNVLQAELLRNLRPDGRGLTVVGDDAQSIYSFRAATVRNILDFPNQFTGTTTVMLEQNYRSTQPILEATNRVIGQAAERHAKDLWSARSEGPRPVLSQCMDEDEQSDWIIERILQHRETGVPLQKQAVLFRASHHSLMLEAELSRRNIPYHKYGGLKFIETAHVKDLMAFLRLAENPRDVVSTMRVLLLLPGIGQKRARQLCRMLEAAQGDFGAWDDYSPPSATEKDWPRFLKLIKRLKSRPGSPQEVAQQVHQIRKFYGPLLDQKYDDARSRRRDLDQMEKVASRFTERSAFLAEMTLDPPTSTQDFADDALLDEDFLVLSTIHSAKGLEWDAVYVIHAADGNIPSDMAAGDEEQMDEELRLFYVALTRAKQWLYVSYPQRYYHRHRRDSHSYAMLTRFLPEDLAACFESEMPGLRPESNQAEAATTDRTSADVRRQMKDMWT